MKFLHCDPLILFEKRSGLVITIIRKRPAGIAQPKKRIRNVKCLLCTDEKVFRFVPSSFGPLARLAKDSTVEDQLTRAIWYRCPYCAPLIDVKLDLESGESSSNPARLSVDTRASRWMVAKLIKSGIDPYLAFENAMSTAGAIDSITKAQEQMIEKIEQALMSLAQNISRECYEPPPEKCKTVEELLGTLVPACPSIATLQNSIRDDLLIIFLKLLCKITKWYPVGAGRYLSALERLLSQVPDPKPSDLEAFVQAEVRIIEDDLYVDCIKVDALQCPPSLMVAALGIDNTREKLPRAEWKTTIEL